MVIVYVRGINGGASNSCDKLSPQVLNECGLKHPKTLRDILNAISSSYAKSVRQLETVGFIHYGLGCRLIRLDFPVGYVASITITPEDRLLTLPAKADQFKQGALPVILLAWQAKEIAL
ncbi:hypothetical protein BCR42DRAFT_435162 [Absidia repens]|uniref:Uncharacterized protein n=1 Tax=Absidia repens TaxID=90262 RepID=A0A1X2IR74_9FUNG|nr:hypothetical protein BCR42DRAFT_435162 [Absidia repens]